ncbi:MAG TPA: IPT/TIG domain-containing protein, partial [Planctomycetota bacterium]|nr:IPT/TIG domain-containing protein [Planctomycetota bacterium]
AYVFRNTTGTTWAQEAKLVGTDAAVCDLAGSAVSIYPTDNDLAAVGAPGKDGTGTDSGAVYLFRRTGTTWAQEAKLTASDAGAGDQFGCAVAVSGDLVAVGAYLEDTGATDAGAVYIFRKSGAVWSQEAKLQASDLAAGDYYGVSVALAGNHLAVGSYNDGSGAGSIYVHDKPGASWVQTAKLTQAGTGLLGSAAGVTADFVGGGASVTDVGGTSLAGAAYAWSTIPTPTVLSVAPTSGLFNVATPVTITGSSFSEAGLQGVTFDGVPATSVTWVSPTSITCTAPTGAQNQVADVTVTQNGLSHTLINAYTYVGADIVSISPGSGPSIGGPNVTLTGTNFINDGSTVVTFGGTPAAVISVTPTQVVVDPPAGTRGTSVNVVLTCTNGTDTVVNGWTYELLSILAVDKPAKNLLGGSTITLTVNFPTTLPDTSVTLGGSPMTVTAVTATTVSFTAPGVPEPTGTALDIAVTNSNGSDTELGAFHYSPALITAGTGNTAAGGTVSFDWKADVDAAGQLVYLWVGDPLQPPIAATLADYAGVLHHVPYLFILSGFPENPHPLVLNYGPLPAAIAGVPLPFQALVTGEGGPKGSFSNVRNVIIP